MFISGRLLAFTNLTFEVSRNHHQHLVICYLSGGTDWTTHFLVVLNKSLRWWLNQEPQIFLIYATHLSMYFMREWHTCFTTIKNSTVIYTLWHSQMSQVFHFRIKQILMYLSGVSSVHAWIRLLGLIAYRVYGLMMSAF